MPDPDHTWDAVYYFSTKLHHDHGGGADVSICPVLPQLHG
jgi:hypothetical protein